MIPTLHIQLLGGFRLTCDATPVTTLDSPRLQALLAYLLLHRAAPHARAHLAFQLWPDTTEAQAHANLRTLLHRLRHALPDADQFLHIDAQTVQWRSDAPATLDVADVEQALAQVEAADRASDQAAVSAALQEVAERYRGDLLPALYDDWVLVEREQLRQAFLAALERLILLLEQAGDYTAAIGHAQQLLRHDPLHEATYQHLMRLHAASGDRASALRVYHTCATLLKRELGVGPSPATRETYERLLRMDLPLAPSAIPPTTAPHQARHNLPAQLTQLIGRTQEVAAVCDLLRHTHVRLLTLTGSGGVGKTRLALQVAAELLDDFTDGVYFVDLAPIRDYTLVASTIAHILGVKESGDQPLLAGLKAYLRGKLLLLVLDNFEQIQAAAPLVVELLVAAPNLKVLVTSRAVLHLSGEHEFVVPSLAVPDLACLPPLDDLSRYAAVRLFIERAQAVQAAFTITSDLAPAVAEICQRLDGLPLAIELAAARSKLFAPKALLARLHNRLAFLAGGPLDLPERQQTLRNTIDWSYQLLSQSEQTLFRRLAVFVGGCTLEAVEVVCAADDNLSADLTAGVARLVDQSLLRQTEGPGGEPRFTMLETIREYALQRLEASGAERQVRWRHAAFFVDMIELIEPELRGPQQLTWLARLETEYSNLRAVAEWALQHPNTDHLARLVNALELFWIKRGHLSEGRHWAENALARLDRADPTVVDVRLLRTAMLIAWMQGDMVSARAWGVEGLSVARHVGDAYNIALALSWLGWMEFWVGNYQDAYALLEEAVQVARASGDPWAIGVALALFGHEILKRRADVAVACDLFEESAALFQQIGDIHFLSFAREFLGHSWLHRGHPEEARIHYQEALAMRQYLNDHWSIGWALYNLGQAELAANNLEAAARCFEVSLARFENLGTQQGIVPELIRQIGMVARQTGDIRLAKARFLESLKRYQTIEGTSGIINCLVDLGRLEADQGQVVQGLRLLCAANRHIQTSGMETNLSLRDALDHARMVACSQLDVTAVEAECAAGRNLSLEQAIAAALSGTDPSTGSTASAH